MCEVPLRAAEIISVNVGWTIVEVDVSTCSAVGFSLRIAVLYGRAVASRAPELGADTTGADGRCRRAGDASHPPWEAPRGDAGCGEVGARARHGGRAPGAVLRADVHGGGDEFRDVVQEGVFGGGDVVGLDDAQAGIDERSRSRTRCRPTATAARRRQDAAHSHEAGFGGVSTSAGSTASMSRR